MTNITTITSHIISHEKTGYNAHRLLRDLCALSDLHAESFNPYEFKKTLVSAGINSGTAGNYCSVFNKFLACRDKAREEFINNPPTTFGMNAIMQWLNSLNAASAIKRRVRITTNNVSANITKQLDPKVELIIQLSEECGLDLVIANLKKLAAKIKVRDLHCDSANKYLRSEVDLAESARHSDIQLLDSIHKYLQN